MVRRDSPCFGAARCHVIPAPQFGPKHVKAQKCGPVHNARDYRLHSRAKPIIWAAKSTTLVGFPSGCLPGVVHSLFKEYYSCARSFSQLLLPAPLSLCRPARVKKRPKPPPPLKPLLRKLRPIRLTPLLLALPVLLKPLATLPRLLATLLLPPVRPLLVLPTLLATLPRLPAKPLPTLLRRCNLRRTAKNWGRGRKLPRPFSLPAARSPLDRFNRAIKLGPRKREESG
jgi:hypothetical protein